MHLAPSPTSNLCDLQGWSPVTGEWVALSGGLAGFVFTGIVFILSSSKKKARTENSSYVLKLLITSFFSLTIIAYLFSTLSGEKICARAATAHEFLGSVLASATISMIVALSWMIEELYKTRDFGVLNFLHAIIYFTLLLTVAMLLLSAISYVNGMRPNERHYIATLLMITFTAICLIAYAILMFVKHRKTSWPYGSFVSLLTWGTLAQLTVASIATIATLSFPPSSWAPQPSSGVVYLAASAALVIPTIVLGISIGAVARR
ncbi:hypothetical protein [Spirillospora sp. NPDC048823]|uniref:hypothetical protein n=1 Tax=unclassified Spirillospora TaxID=2642701 RepID=UPI0037231CF7